MRFKSITLLVLIDQFIVILLVETKLKPLNFKTQPIGSWY